MKGKFSGSIVSSLFTALDFSLLACEDCNVAVKASGSDREPLDADVFVSNIVQMINSASEKISSLLGEIRNFVNEKVTKKFKKTI